MGLTDDKKPICLIQHVSQLSFVLTALPKLDPDKPKRRYGFGPPEATPPAAVRAGGTEGRWLMASAQYGKKVERQKGTS